MASAGWLSTNVDCREAKADAVGAVCKQPLQTLHSYSHESDQGAPSKEIEI